MFLVTQFLGLLVTSAYSPIQKSVYNESSGQYENVTINPLPAGFQSPELKSQTDFLSMLLYLSVSFVIAILLIFLLMRIKTVLFLRIWFLIVVIIAIALFFNAVFFKLNFLSRKYFQDSLSHGLFQLLLQFPSHFSRFSKEILLFIT